MASNVITKDNRKMKNNCIFGGCKELNRQLAFKLLAEKSTHFLS